MDNQPDVPTEPSFSQPQLPPRPTPEHDTKKALLFLKVVIIVVLLAIYGAGMLFLGTKQPFKKKEQPKVINPRQTVQQGLVKNLQTKTVSRHITYRDNVDSGMLVTWDIASDFSNPRDPKSKGTLTIDYLRGKEQIQQQVEYITVKDTKSPYQNGLYFRMVKGNETTNAPKDWFYLSSSDVYSIKNREIHERDQKVNLFGLNKSAVGFQNFTGFDFFLYNSPAFYIIDTTMRDTPQTAKVRSELENDKAYALQDCGYEGTRAWCGGSFNTGGLQSISTNFATSEGLGNSPGLVNIPATQFWLTVNTDTQRIEKLEVGTNDDHKFVSTYSNYDQLVEITLPTTFIK